MSPMSESLMPVGVEGFTCCVVISEMMKGGNEMSTQIMGIYKIENKINGKVYIGSSKNVGKRLKEHQRLLNRNKHLNDYIQDDWNKYGKDAFEFNIIEELDNLNELFTKERFYIIKFNSLNRDKGYNITKVCIPRKLSGSVIQKLTTNRTIDLLELGLLSILIEFISYDGSLIYEERPLTQKDIIKLSKLGRSKVSLILKHLQEINIISELAVDIDQRKKSYLLNLDITS